MAMTEKDLARLGPAARAQIQAELARRDRARKARRLLVDAAQAGPLLPDAESNLERRYYAAVLRPKIMAGLVESWEMHRRFELLPADTYCGLRLPAAHYTPDFFICRDSDGNWYGWGRVLDYIGVEWENAPGQLLGQMNMFE